jgi:hypothetical protein
MKKTLFENLKTDILIEKNSGLMSPMSANKIIDYIDNLYIYEEKKRTFDLIKFVRTNDKMGKSIEDLYNEFLNQK